MREYFWRSTTGWKGWNGFPHCLCELINGGTVVFGDSKYTLEAPALMIAKGTAYWQLFTAVCCSERQSGKIWVYDKSWGNINSSMRVVVFWRGVLFVLLCKLTSIWWFPGTLQNKFSGTWWSLEIISAPDFLFYNIKWQRVFFLFVTNGIQMDSLRGVRVCLSLRQYVRLFNHVYSKSDPKMREQTDHPRSDGNLLKPIVSLYVSLEPFLSCTQSPPLPAQHHNIWDCYINI